MIPPVSLGLGGGFSDIQKKTGLLGSEIQFDDIIFFKWIDRFNHQLEVVNNRSDRC